DMGGAGCYFPARFDRGCRPPRTRNARGFPPPTPREGEEVMTVSRWKVMAGVLGVSIGGLAAIAGQCPRPGEARTHRADEKPADGPKVVPPAGGGPAAPALPPIEVPPAGPANGLPPLPGPAPTPAADPLKLPAVPPPGSAQATPPTV